MKPNVCRLCETAHWSHEAHALAGVQPRPLAKELGRDRGGVATAIRAKPVTEKIRAGDSRGCPVCGGSIPESKTKPRRYCSATCRIKASRTPALTRA